jgi:hypothetical protein
VGFKSGHQCRCVRPHGRGLGGTNVIRDPHARPPIVPRHSRPLATISTAPDRLGIDAKPDASLGVGHPLAVGHVRGTCPGRDYRRLMVEEGLKARAWEACTESVSQANQVLREDAASSSSRAMRLTRCRTWAADQDPRPERVRILRAVSAAARAPDDGMPLSRSLVKIGAKLAARASAGRRRVSRCTPPIRH